MIASRVSHLLEDHLGHEAPVVAHRSSGFRYWSIGDRSAWLTHYADAAQLRLMFEPYVEGQAEPTFLVDDERTIDEIALCLGEFFTVAGASPA
jgi:hypothetical protein